MFLQKMEVKNFRALKDFTLDFKKELSLVIGKNNCGKTSALIVLDKMLNSSKIMWEDINLEWQKELFSNIKKYQTTDNNVASLEAFMLRLYIEYDLDDSYKNIQKFMMDLNPENNIIVLEFVSVASDKKVADLVKIIHERKIRKFAVFSKYMSKNFAKFFEVKKYSRGYDIERKVVTGEKSEEIDNSDIVKVIKVSGIRADRAVSNDDRNHVLSSLTGKYYSSYKTARSESESIFSKLEQKLADADKELYTIYNGKKRRDETIPGVFSNVIEVIKTYGGLENGIDIAIESSISEKNLLSDNTCLSYRQGSDSSLPETYNGLGYLNLIGILFEIETKIQELFDQPADVNLLYIEEPEAHTHPQLQYIFIRNIKSHIKTRRDMLFQEKKKRLQVLITSHSSHIVSECNFDDVVYLKRVDGGAVVARSFNSLKAEYKDDIQKGFKFVKQYLSLNRSELFFTDKAICVEGDTERILMPMMMYKIDRQNTENSTCIPLLSQNISIVEVGAYSHVFMPLFDFLGIKVLVITDLDTARKNDAGKYVREKPTSAQYTTNASIKYFFQDTNLAKSDNQVLELVEKREKDKIKKNKIRIAYQIPEPSLDCLASSFEDAFIALNKRFITRNKDGLVKYGALKDFDESDISCDCYRFAIEKILKKSAFASSLLFFDNEDGEDDEKWRVPYYIEEGLLWLRQF